MSLRTSVLINVQYPTDQENPRAGKAVFYTAGRGPGFRVRGASLYTWLCPSGHLLSICLLPLCKGAVSQSALATRTKYHKYHRPGALNNRHLSFISHGSGTGKRSGCQHDRVLVKACRWPCSCCILTWERKGERGRDRERETERQKEEQDPTLWCLLRRPLIPS